MSSESHIYTIAFYNTENLYDYHQDRRYLDQDYVPTSARRWTKQRYEQKIRKLGSVIAQIGSDSSYKPPVIVGLAEVENDTVLKDLIGGEALDEHPYGFVHYDSPDERGIDVALLYHKEYFRLLEASQIPLLIEDDFGTRDYTRDILLVSGFLENEKIHIIVNHWPSRHQGVDKTEYKRILAAEQVTEVISQISTDEPNSKIIVMGDFNDNPNSASIQKLKADNGLYNAMESIWSYSRGSVNHKFTWIQFDQIFLTHNFLDERSTGLKFLRAEIFDEKFLTQYEGKYRGQPYRTFIGKKYKGGFSDHFPVYVQLKRIK